MYLLPITGVDLVLGAAWLATLGPHIADYSALTIKFYMGDSFVTLHGEPPRTPASAQFHHIKRLYHTHAIVEYFTLQIQPLTEPPEDMTESFLTLPPELQALLVRYKGVFAKPTGLPPERAQNHAIPLLDDSNPVKVKPYRYLHSQKAQIEQMVSEMLTERIIQPSTSLFSSSVLLVKKKDGT